MIFNNPIPRSGLPRYNEASQLRSPRDSDANARLWHKDKQVGAQLDSLVKNVQQVQRQLDRLRRRAGSGGEPVAEAPYPFKVLTSPGMDDTQANTAEPGSTAAEVAWRTFRVRAGAVLAVPVVGTDGADENPDDPAIDPTPGYDPLIDFVVPEGKAHYYVYIDRDTAPEIPAIALTETEPADTFWVGKFILIADITTTDTTNKTAVVRQYQRSDVNEPPNYCNPDI